MSLVQLVGSNLRGKPGNIRADGVDAEVIGFYFSAHWCPPCRAFTPRLAEVYNRCKQKGKSFEIIFVSSDQSPQQFEEYYRTMPWLAVPFEDRARHASLSSAYSIRGIPALILVNKSTGRVITADGRSAVMQPSFDNTLPDGKGGSGAAAAPLSVDKLDPSVRHLSVEEALEAVDRAGIEMEARKAAYNTLGTIANNILNNPSEAKYKSLKKDNKAVQTKLGKPEFLTLLKLCGFVEGPDAFEFPKNGDFERLMAAKEILGGLLASMDS